MAYNPTSPGGEATPPLTEWLEKAKLLNPGVPDADLRSHYDQRYSKTLPADLPTYDAWVKKARPLNPTASDADLKEHWQSQYGDRGASETERGDVSRGFETGMGQFVPTLKGGVALGAEVGEQIFGKGGVFTDVKNWGLKGYEEGMQKLSKVQKANDDIEVAWGKAKDGDYGALLDWAQYAFGYTLAQTAQTAGIGIAGALTGGAAGVVGIGAMAEQTAARGIIGRLLEREAARRVAAGMTKDVATRTIARDIGALTAVGTSSILQEAGQIYPPGIELARKENGELSGTDVARMVASSVVSGLTDVAPVGITGGMVLGRFDNLIKAMGSTATRRAITGAIAGGTFEGAQEALQAAIEHYGAGQPIADEAGRNDIVNSGAMGAFMGLTMGALAGTAGSLHVREFAKQHDPNAPEAKLPASIYMDDVASKEELQTPIGGGPVVRRPSTVPLQDILRERESVIADISDIKSRIETVVKSGQPVPSFLEEEYRAARGRLATIGQRAPEAVATPVTTEPDRRITDAPTVEAAITAADTSLQAPVTTQALDAVIAAQKTGTPELSPTVVPVIREAMTASNQNMLDEAFGNSSISHRAPEGVYYNNALMKAVDPASLPVDSEPTDVGSSLSRGQYEAVSRFAGLFGKRVIVFNYREGLPDGAYNRRDAPDTIFLGDQSSVNPFAIISHELAHTMEGTKFYDAFLQIVHEERRDTSRYVAEKRGHIQPGKGGLIIHLGDKSLEQEMGSDIFGTAVHRPDFWQKVFTRLAEQTSPAEAKSQLRMFLDLLGDIVAKAFLAIRSGVWQYGGRDIALSYVKNIERVHDALATAVAEHLRQLPRTEREKLAEGRVQKSEPVREIVHPEVVKVFEEIRDQSHRNDLLRYMAGGSRFGIANKPFVDEIVDRLVRRLTQTSEVVLKDDVLKAFGKEYQTRSVYNLPQWLARESALAVKENRFNDARTNLKELQKIVKSPEYDRLALASKFDQEGKLLPYLRPIKAAYIGEQKGYGPIKGFSMYNLMEPTPKHPVGSTVAPESMAKEGYRLEPADVISEAQARERLKLSRKALLVAPEERTTVSTTVPRSKGMAGAAYRENWIITGEEIRSSEKHVETLANALNQFPMMSGKAKGEAVLKEFQQKAVKNLLWLYDLVPENVRARAQQWYKGANRIVTEWAMKNGYSTRQNATVLAVLSPQKDWFMNVSLAERMLNIMKNEQETAWSPEMTAWVEQFAASSLLPATRAVRNQMLMDARQYEGIALKDLDNRATASFVRVYDETYNDRSHRLVTPEGGFGEFVTNKDSVDSDLYNALSGPRSLTAWGDFGVILKAVSVLRDGSAENIDRQLGGAHKVRNFFNNIVAPGDLEGHVTIDTHAVGAAILQAVSLGSHELSAFMPHGRGGTTTTTGAEGGYGILADAYREAAKKRGILPSEFQPVVWEAIRTLFPSAIKEELAPKIDAIWAEYRSGKLTLPAARERIYLLSGGIQKFSWQDGGLGLSPANGGTSYERTVTEPTGEEGLREPRGVPRGEELLALSRRPYQGPGKEGRDLIGLPTVVPVNGQEIEFHSFKPAQDAAKAYMEKAGLPYKPETIYHKLNPERAASIAQAYEDMAHDPTDARVKESYSAMVRETLAQYQAMLEAGVVVEFNDGADPYINPRNAVLDVVDNNHLYVFSTKDGFGSDVDFKATGNPMLAPTKFLFGGKPTLVNDIFRAVHDYFGHVKEGNGFRAEGEENAWYSHAAMYSPLALPAMTTETRGQNSWVNYGPYGEQNRTATAAENRYADQKTGLMPEWTMEREELQLSQRAPGASNFEVFDTQTGQVVASRKTSRMAHNVADKKDLEYGAIRYGVREVAAAPSGRAIQLEHYTTREGLTTVRPAKMGEGQMGAERERMEAAPPGQFVPRSYFNRAGAEVEPRFRNLLKYTAAVDQDRIVDLATVAGKDATAKERNAKAQGYLGYYNSEGSNPDAIAMFHPIPVTREEVAPQRSPITPAEEKVGAVGQAVTPELARREPLGVTRPTTLYVVRHGETKNDKGDGNIERHDSQLRTPLDERGHKSAEKVATKLEDVNPTRIVSSDLPRATETAQYISEATGVPYEVDPRLRAWNTGTLSGKVTKPEDAQDFRDHTSKYPDQKFHGGESYNEFAARLKEVFSELMAGPGPVIVVGHSNGDRWFKAWEKKGFGDTIDTGQFGDLTSNGEPGDVEKHNIKGGIQLAPRTPAEEAVALQAQRATAGYAVPSPGGLDKVIRVLQDKNIDIKRFVEAVREAGKVVPEELDPILKEEMFHKRAEQRSVDFKTDELRPLIEAMRLNNVTLADFDKYLQARHVIADNVNENLQAINPDMAGTPEFERLSGMSNDEAAGVLAGVNRPMMEGLAARVDSIVEKTRQLMVDYGLESPATIDSWRRKYRAYVPLMREGFEEEGFRTGTGQSVRGTTVQRRLGSGREVVNILANLAQQRDMVITRGEKMRPVVAMAGLLMLHPNVAIGSLDKPASVEMTDPATGLTSQVPGDLADYKVPRIRRYDPITDTVKSYPDPAYKGRDNVVNFRVEGKDYAIVFNEENERAREMAYGFKNLGVAQLNGIMKVAAPWTRYLASINTQYNPIFGLVNFVRDASFAMLALGSTPIAGRRAEVFRNAVSSLSGIYQDARAVRSGGHPTSAVAQLWERFERVGGPTGYRDIFMTSEDRSQDIERLLNPKSWTELRTPRQLGQKIEDTGLFKWLSDYNLTMENSMRLGVFKTAIDSGMSDMAAASIAKNITVNFNKKGQIGAQMGSLYAFFNANVQGTARIMETLFDKSGALTAYGKKIVAGGALLGIMQTFALAAAGYDDQDVPEYVKQRSLIIPIPGTDKKYVSIPLPLGFNLLPSIGRLAAESLWYGKPIERGFSLLSAMFNALSPTGGSSGLIQELSPTVTDPFVALESNRDWTGKAISKEDISTLKPTPGFTRKRDTATWWSTELSKMINWVTGGTDYQPGVLSPTPDAIDYLIQQATGGVGREVSKVAQFAQGAYTGEEVPFYKIPVAGRFGGEATGAQAIRERFYENVKEVNVAAEEIKGRAKDRKEFASFAASHPYARFESVVTSTERALGVLQKQKRQMIEKGASREAIRLQEDRITGLMQRINHAIANSIASSK